MSDPKCVWRRDRKRRRLQCSLLSGSCWQNVEAIQLSDHIGFIAGEMDVQITALL